MFSIMGKASFPLRRLGLVLGLCWLLSGREAGAQSGTLDLSFDSVQGVGTNGLVYSIAVQNDGKMVVAGDFTTFGGASRTNVARLLSNGLVDNGFSSGSAINSSFSYVNAVAVDHDGKVLVAGSFSSSAGTNMIRLNTNGVLDTTFHVQTDDTINAVTLQQDGSMLVGGFFTLINGVSRGGLARINSNGVVDSLFNPILSGDFGASVFALAIQPDGKIVVGGSFTNVNGGGRTNLARLMLNGTSDTNFSNTRIQGGQFSATVYAVGIDSSTNISAAGDFSLVNSFASSNICRLAGSGMLDSGFSGTSGTDFAVNSLYVQADGKILASGYFTEVNSEPHNYLVRFNSNGGIDADFKPSSEGADAVIYCVTQQPDNKVLIGGGFRSYDGVARYGIARLQNVVQVSAPLLINLALNHGAFSASIMTVNGKSYFLEAKASLEDTNWVSSPAVLGDGTVKTLTDPAASSSHKFYRARVQ
jgi:uncharacterized delta-60 repeat protein